MPRTSSRLWLPTHLSFVLITVLLALAGRSHGSKISFFSDGECNDYDHDLRGPDDEITGGECSLLSMEGNFGSFKVVSMDHRCAVTIYKPVADPTLTCNAQTALWAKVGECFEASTWTYFGITDCVIPKDSNSSSSSSSSSSASEAASSSPSSSATSTATSTPDSGARTTAAPGSQTFTTSAAGESLVTDTNPPPQPTSPLAVPNDAESAQQPQTNPTPATTTADTSNTGAIAGGVAGGVVGLGLVAMGLWICLRRRKQSQGQKISSPVELSAESPRFEMSAAQAEKAVELSQYRASRLNEADTLSPAMELSAIRDRGSYEGWGHHPAHRGSGTGDGDITPEFAEFGYAPRDEKGPLR